MEKKNGKSLPESSPKKYEEILGKLNLRHKGSPKRSGVLVPREQNPIF
jgi:hypothetical protein